MQTVDVTFQWSVRALEPGCSMLKAFYSICSQMGLEVDTEPSMTWLRGVFNSLDLMYYTQEGDEDILLDRVWATPVLPPPSAKYDDMYYTARRTYTIRLHIKQPCHLSDFELAVCLKDILVSHLSTIVYRPFTTPRAGIYIHLITVHEILPQQQKAVKRRLLPGDISQAHEGFFSRPVE
jgi:hypothetical protein